MYSSQVKFPALYETLTSVTTSKMTNTELCSQSAESITHANNQFIYEPFDYLHTHSYVTKQSVVSSEPKI